MDDTMEAAIAGAAGGAGAVVGGAVGILFDGSLIVALLLATGLGGILGGSLMLWHSRRRSAGHRPN